MNKKVLLEKAEILSRMIMNTRADYMSSGATEKQKGLLETLVGAGIWYLPSSDELYSGKISVSAYEALQANPRLTKLVEEHGYPRKVAGNHLYTKYFDRITPDGSGLVDLYVNHFGRFNLVLKIENGRLKPFQKVSTFVDESSAYEHAGIDLVPFSVEEYKEYKRALR